MSHAMPTLTAEQAAVPSTYGPSGDAQYTVPS